MSLEGSIKEFGLAEILQLISMQKKSGVVSISHKSESTKLHFDNGQLVFATAISGGETKRLGEILKSAGKMTEDQVAESLRKQEITKERIGNVFVSSGHVSTDEVKEALQQQLMEVIFHVLRWKDGYYKFTACEIDYDREFQITVQTDFILMEGSRMVDEWGLIEARIPSSNIVFSQTERGAEIEHLFSRLSPDEITVYNLVDGSRDITDILNVAEMPQFPLYRIMLTLLMSGLITQRSLKKDIIYENNQAPDDAPAATDITPEENTGSSIRLKYAFQIAALIFILIFILLLFPAGKMAGMNELTGVSDFLRNQETMTRLQYLKRAIGYYYLDNGSSPESLSILISQNYLEAGIIYDAWGNKFIYDKYPVDKASWSYRLYSTGKDRVASTHDDVY
ncbi:MAG: DUF4388 domain-containing protein [Nitrospirae bacterium]|nr:DUF4388 domain-containing protein [Nitrospirota bacterium]